MCLFVKVGIILYLYTASAKCRQAILFRFESNIKVKMKGITNQVIFLKSGPSN